MISQGSVARMQQKAALHWKHREFREGIELLERAARLDPANATLLVELGSAYGQRYDYAAAERCFEKAIRVATCKSDVLSVIGRKSHDFRSPQIAERYLRQALEHKDVAPEILVQLAELYERARRRADAEELVDRALGLNAGCAAALLVRARLERQAGRLESGEAAIRALLRLPDPGATPSPARDTRIRAWYELGLILDRQQRFEEAMAAVLHAKSMLRLNAAQGSAELEAVRGRVQQMLQGLSAEKFQEWHDFAAQLQPARRLALLCGHPRSGTTLMEQVLDSHADVLSAEETEIFVDDVYLPLARGFPEDTPVLAVLEDVEACALRRSRDSYFRSMELSMGQSIGRRLLLDKNPILTLMIPAVVRVFPEIRLLVAVRDPRDVVLSCFMQSFVPLGQVGSACLSLAGGVEEYAGLLTVWMTVAPLLRTPWLEVRYEDAVDNLEPVARRVLDFLGSSWDERVLQFDQHARQKMVRSPSYADVVQPVFKRAVGRWRNYQKYLEPHLAKLEPFAKAFGYE